MKFTGILAEIAGAAGADAAEAVARACGGTRVHLPGVATLETKNGADNWLVRLVGADAARKIAETCSPRRGVQVEIPLGPFSQNEQTRRAIDSLLAQGLSAAKVARATGCTERAVRRHKRNLLSGPPIDPRKG